MIKNGCEIGFWPNCGPKRNSDYMSDYLSDFGSQIRKWIDNESLIHLSAENDLRHHLEPIQLFKTTIEPQKPRCCIFSKLVPNN